MVITCISDNAMLESRPLPWLKRDMRLVSRELWKSTPVQKMMFLPGTTPLDILEKYRLNLRDLRVGAVEDLITYDVADLINRCTRLDRLQCYDYTFCRVDLRCLPLLRSLHICSTCGSRRLVWGVQDACDVEVLSCFWYQDENRNAMHTVAEKFPKLRRLTVFGVGSDYSHVHLQPLCGLEALDCVKLVFPRCVRQPSVAPEPDLPFVLKIE